MTSTTMKETKLTDDRTERPDDCDCDSLSTDGGLPCFACWIAGFDDHRDASTGEA